MRLLAPTASASPRRGERERGEIRLPCCRRQFERASPRSQECRWLPSCLLFPITVPSRFTNRFDNLCCLVCATHCLPCFYPHSKWAALGPVLVGVRSKSQVHSPNGDGPGLLGAAILASISSLKDHRGDRSHPNKAVDVCYETFRYRLVCKRSTECRLPRVPSLCLGLFRRQPAEHDVTAHRPLRSPTADAVIPTASALPPPPHASSRSSRRARSVVARTAVGRCPVRTAPEYSVRSLPRAAAASHLPSC